eukprot:10397935-Ditylum_brightwellii.AAC.1
MWPFCYKAAEERYNKLDVDADGWSPLVRALGYKDGIVAEDFYTWDCPVYIFDHNLQTGTMIGTPKVGPQIQSWCLSWLFTSSCWQCSTGPQPVDW